MRNRSAGHRDAHHVAASAIDRLAHRFRNFIGFAGRETDAALPISHCDERVEREAASALYDFRDAIDRDDVLDQLAATIPTSAVAIATLALAASPATLAAFAPRAAALSTALSAGSATATGSTTAGPATPAAAATATSTGAATAASATAHAWSFLCRLLGWCS
jgi:hypothetical protein